MIDLWVVIHVEDMMNLMRRAQAGEDVEMLWIEFYANSDSVPTT